MFVLLIRHLAQVAPVHVVASCLYPGLGLYTSHKNRVFFQVAKKWASLKRDKGLSRLKLKLGCIVYMPKQKNWDPKVNVKAVSRILLCKAKL